MTRPAVQDRSGPWRSADYNQFAQLCDYGYPWLDGELLGSPVYGWLKKHAPHAVAVKDSGDLPYKRMLLVVQYITIMMRPAGWGGPRDFTAEEVARTRKWHKKAQTQIRRLQKILGDGRILLPRLDEALVWALPLLNVRSTKATQPWLERLARELYRQTGAAEAPLLLEIAQALGLDLDERTAQRYAKEARAAGQKPTGNRRKSGRYLS